MGSLHEGGTVGAMLITAIKRFAIGLPSPIIRHVGPIANSGKRPAGLLPFSGPSVSRRATGCRC